MIYNLPLTSSADLLNSLYRLIEIIEAVKLDIKNFQENCSKSEIVRFLDYTIILGKELNFSDEFMEKLYFLRYYYNIGKQFI